MAANRVGRRVNKVCNPSAGRAGGGGGRESGPSLQRRQARVTVKYNRKELQRRLDVEKWIDCGLDELYRGRVNTAVLLLLILSGVVLCIHLLRNYTGALLLLLGLIYYRFSSNQYEVLINIIL